MIGSYCPYRHEPKPEGGGVVRFYKFCVEQTEGGFEVVMLDDPPKGKPRAQKETERRGPYPTLGMALKAGKEGHEAAVEWYAEERAKSVAALKGEGRAVKLGTIVVPPEYGEPVKPTTKDK